MNTTPNNETTRARSYDVTLREFFNVLKIHQAAGVLPPNFTDSMDNFVLELNALIADQQSRELARAA